MKTNRPGGLTLTREALGACRFRPGDRVLDAGCGFGATLDLIRRSGGIRAVGLDMDVSRLAQPRGTAREANRGEVMETVPAVAASLPRMPFRAGSFQGIFCECVFSLVPDKVRCLEEFYTVLAPGGILVLADLVLPETAVSSGIPGGAVLRDERPGTCLDGALTLSALTAEVAGAGFRITKVEEHTRLLREMACQMVFEHGSLDRFWQTLGQGDFPTGAAGACRAGSLKPGYAMVTATKGG